MSVQFGRLNFEGQPIDPEYVAQVRNVLALYSPDSITVCGKDDFFILYGAFHSTEESRHERQPYVSPTGTYLTWTGRLDNGSELIEKTTGRMLSLPATDLGIVSSLYESKGKKAFSHLIGDWSVSALHHNERALILAVDFAGMQPLYYLNSDRYVAWSSVLEPLVTLAGRTFTLCEGYVAGWLYGFPPAFLTPYNEIRSVPPGSCVEITPSAAKIGRYWDFDPGKRLHLSKDSEYEEGFRYFFTQAVRRRLRSRGPVASELSGGMDSSSIVCIADRILQNNPSLTPRLDTLSYLNDTEPGWDERPFVATIEGARGRVGVHVDVSMMFSFIPEVDPTRFSATPAIGISPSIPQRQVSAYLRDKDIRVVLSGVGGDEATGGVPTGIPELADLLVRARLVAFGRQALAWSLAARRPIAHTVASVISEFLRFPPTAMSSVRGTVPWVNPIFLRRARTAEWCAPQRLRVLGARPSFQENLSTLDDLRRRIACFSRESIPVRERRCPFLDRDLLAFLYSVPREQIVRPGRRRSLMRRALRTIVPDAILERRRKAYVVRGPLKSLQAESRRLQNWTTEMLCASIGAIDLEVFQATLDQACRGNDSHLWRIGRTLALESWLRDPEVQSVLRLPAVYRPTDDLGNLRRLHRLPASKSP